MIGVVLDLLLAGLLTGALFFGVRLNARLKALRDSQAGFAAAALELNGAIARAESGLAEIRMASREAEQGLMERVDEARLMVKRLHEIMERASRCSPAERGSWQPGAARLTEGAPPPPPGAPSVSALSRRATSLALSGAGEDQVVELKDRLPQAARSRARIDDELFIEDETVPQMLQRLRAGVGW